MDVVTAGDYLRVIARISGISTQILINQRKNLIDSFLDANNRRDIEFCLRIH